MIHRALRYVKILKPTRKGLEMESIWVPGIPKEVPHILLNLRLTGFLIQTGVTLTFNIFMWSNTTVPNQQKKKFT